MPPEGGKNIQIPSVVFGVFIQSFVKAAGCPFVAGYSSGYSQADFAVESINVADAQGTVVVCLFACINSETQYRSEALLGHAVGIGNGQETIADGKFMVPELFLGQNGYVLCFAKCTYSQSDD